MELINYSFVKLPTNMSNLRYFMSKSLTHNNQNINIKRTITNVIVLFMVERYVRISTADSQNSYLA